MNPQRPIVVSKSAVMMVHLFKRTDEPAHGRRMAWSDLEPYIHTESYEDAARTLVSQLSDTASINFLLALRKQLEAHIESEAKKVFPDP